MAKRGPKRTSNKILKLRDSWRTGRKPAPPIPEDGIPACPSWLSKEAKKEWKLVVPGLHAMGLLKKIDRNVLTQYCDAWAKWCQMSQYIDDKGVMYAIRGESVPSKVKGKPYELGPIKYLQQVPHVGIYHRLHATLARLQGELGLTPAARSRMEVAEPQKQENAKDRFLKFG